jgi:uncharacterized RDD family membrane protein YckC
MSEPEFGGGEATGGDRLEACLIDQLLLSPAYMIVAYEVTVWSRLIGDDGPAHPDAAGIGWARVLLPCLALLVTWAYYAGFEASARQASPGKLALGLTVVTERGGRIGPGQATARYVARLLFTVPSLIIGLFIGVPWMNGPPHDIVSNTKVLYRA